MKHERGKESTYKEIMLTLISPNKQYIDDFIQECWNTYVSDCFKKPDDTKFFYNVDRIADGNIRATGFELLNKKSITDVFIPQINDLKQMIDNFMNKTGPFARHFFPHKLSWILHGVPGCGKTSLIRAVAKYTNRNIINVRLANINTNRDLF